MPLDECGTSSSENAPAARRALGMPSPRHSAHRQVLWREMLAAFAMVAAAFGQVPAPNAACHVHGRVVDVAGAPLSGARVIVSAWRASREPVARRRPPSNWKDSQVETGEDGAFELRFEPPEEYEFAVRVEYAGLTLPEALGMELDAGEERGLGYSQSFREPAPLILIWCPNSFLEQLNRPAG